MDENKVYSKPAWLAKGNGYTEDCLPAATDYVNIAALECYLAFPKKNKTLMGKLVNIFAGSPTHVDIVFTRSYNDDPHPVALAAHPRLTFDIFNWKPTILKRHCTGFYLLNSRLKAKDKTLAAWADDEDGLYLSKLELEGQEKAKLLAFVKEEIGSKYDLYGCLLGRARIEHPERWFCSEFALAALRAMGNDGVYLPGLETIQPCQTTPRKLFKALIKTIK